MLALLALARVEPLVQPPAALRRQRHEHGAPVHRRPFAAQDTAPLETVHQPRGRGRGDPRGFSQLRDRPGLPAAEWRQQEVLRQRQLAGGALSPRLAAAQGQDELLPRAGEARGGILLVRPRRREKSSGQEEP